MIGLALLAPLSSFAEESGANKKKPNIIYILADDLGISELGCYGQQLIETPNIDRLSQEGMTFSNHYSGTAVSAPSRCVLFTGLHTGHAYIRGNDEMASRGDVWNHKAVLADSTLEGQRPVPAETVMIPAVMKQAGYTTACIGKWGLGYPGSASTPNKMGFDFFYGYNCQREAHTYYPPFLYRNEHREYLNNPLVVPHTKLDKGADPYEEKSYAKYTLNEYAPDLMYKEILNFIDLTKDNPFVLFWTTPLPHVPLQELGIYDNTIIIFTSDNGPTFNGGSDSFFFDSAKPFKSEWGWGKASLREGGIRVPMIASWPKKIKAGSKSDLICAFWDIMPTFCEIAKVECPTTDGISFLPELLGKKQNKHDFLYWEFPDSGGQKAIRMGKWKGIVLNIFKGNRKIQLYDLDSDPREQTDVARYHPEIVKRMEDIMKQEHIEPELASFKMPH